MPRNAQGQYFLPDGNPVVPGELVKAEWANTTLEDVGNAITNSLDRSGAGGMTGPFKAAAGTVLHPGISFSEDNTSGLYKESNGVVAGSASGIKQFYWTKNGLFVTSPPNDRMEVANKAYVDALASQATEIIFAFGASKTPADLPANGYIPAGWDSSIDPVFAIQFSPGQSSVYRPANTSDPLYNHVFVYVSTNTVTAGWIDIGTVAGPQGQQGPTGPVGPQGDQGPVGPQGPTGNTGSIGPVGPVGPQGPQGPQGNQGDTGPAGQSVTVIGAFGVSKTPADLPANGYIPANWDAPGIPSADVYVVDGEALAYTMCDPSNPLYGNLYEFIHDGTGFDTEGWINVGSVKGEKGDTGPMGPQGIQGNTGPQGPAGKDGSAGPQGPQGDKGDTGAQGEVGPQGPQGIKGDTGATGPQGPKGDQGPVGPSGGVASVNGLTGAVTLNYNSVGAPSTTGTNASGSSWNIGILGTSASAAKWTTARTISLTGPVTGSASVDGSANVSIATTLSGVPTLAGTQTWTGSNTFGISTFSRNPVITGDPSGTYALLLSPSANVTGITTETTGNYLNFNAKSSTLIGLDKSGNRCTISANLIATGTAAKPGGGAWLDSSDVRLKSNVQTLTTCLNTIDSLNPVSYTWKDGYRNASQNVGFIADEVEQVIPTAITEYTPSKTSVQKFVDGELVTVNEYTPEDQAIVDIVGEGNPIKLLGFKNDIFAYLVGAIKELKAEVDALKAQVK